MRRAKYAARPAGPTLALRESNRHAGISLQNPRAGSSLGNQAMLRRLSRSEPMVRRDPPADASKKPPAAVPASAPAGPAPSPTPDAARSDEVKLNIPWDEILKGNTTLMQVLMPGLQPPAADAAGATPAPTPAAPKGPTAGAGTSPPASAPASAPAGPAPAAPSRLSLKDFGNLSLGLRLGFPDLKTDSDPNAPPSALQQSIQAGEIMNYSMTGKVPSSYQLDKGKLVGACWSLFSTYIAPDVAAKIAKGMSGKVAGGSMSYELDGVLLSDFSGAGVSFTLKFGGSKAPRPARPAAPGPVQPKLKVGSTTDPLEAEADRAADQVMRMPGSAADGAIQRKCAACEEEDKTVHAMNNGQAQAEGEAPPIVGQALSSSGQALDRNTRAFFEKRFDADFSGVRIHTDSLAAQSADAVHARAYATGNHIVFGAGESAGPNRLLAHELAHVVQQQGNSGAAAGRTANGGPNIGPAVRSGAGDMSHRTAIGPGRQGAEQVPIASQSEPVVRAKPDDPDAQGGNGNVDPDAKCMGCSPLSKVTKVDRGVTFTIGVCSDTFDQFNQGSGDVSVGGGCLPVASNTAGQLGFTAADPSGKQAWDTDAHLADCTTPAPKANASTPWQIGFIQTLESSNRGAVYDNGNFISVTNGNKRDALTDKDPPWYDSPGNPSGPQVYPVTPHLKDSPIQWFSITHPDTGGKDFLRSACMTEKFNVWLILNKVGNTPTPATVDFLYHWTISVKQTFILGQGAHPCNKSQWMVAGHQTLSNKGPGKGSATPVFTGPIAKDPKGVTIDTKSKNNPCAAQPQNQAPPQGGAGQNDKKAE